MTERSSRSLSFLTLSIWFAMLPSAIASDREKKAASRELAVGDSAKFDVISKKRFNPSGLKITAGDHYSFVVTENAKWKDATIVCDANGWKSEEALAAMRAFIKKAEKNRRVPAANWFELIGTIGADEDHHFRIGRRGDEWTYTSKVDGELLLFANDLATMYGNNHGSVEVTVTRKAKPGKHQLPINRTKP